jgi:ankyrin repeat protein
MSRSFSIFSILCLSIAQTAAQQNDLVEAAKAGDSRAEKKLLDSGAAANSHDVLGRTALHEAAQNGNVEIFKMLISAGGDIHARDKSGVTPEYIVFHTPDSNVRNAMIRAFPIQAVPRAEPGPWTLESAISHRQPNVVDMLLKLRVDANAINANGDYPLDLAAQKGDAQIVQLLLAHGAAVNLRTRSGSFPIHTASLAGNAEVVKLLLDQGADINCRVSETGETPLYYAASFGRIQVIELLLARGADRKIADASGVTPLAAAVKAGQSDAANLLRR